MYVGISGVEISKILVNAKKKYAKQGRRKTNSVSRKRNTQ